MKLSSDDDCGYLSLSCVRVAPAFTSGSCSLIEMEPDAQSGIEPEATVEEVESDVGELESKLDKTHPVFDELCSSDSATSPHSEEGFELVKLCIGMIDAGKAYNTANKHFVNGIRELAQQSTTDDVIESSLTSFADNLQEMINYHTILFEQAQQSIKAQLQCFIREDLRKFKETKKQFDKVSEEKEVALSRNAQVARNKVHEVEEASNVLKATHHCFRHIVLDYVLQINVLQSKRRSEILKSMLSFMYAHLTFFHQGFDLFSELQPLMKHLTGQTDCGIARAQAFKDQFSVVNDEAQKSRAIVSRSLEELHPGLDQLVTDATKERKDLENKHSTIQQKDFANDEPKLEYNVDAENGIVMEGYLFKRASNAFRTWNRRWFSIQNNQLVYQKKFKDNPTVVVEDLRLCTVKHCEDIERRFCFEVVSPTKSCMMQADSEVKMDRKWSASSGSLDSAGDVKEKMVKGEKSLQGDGALRRLMGITGNSSCCDCGEPEPRWASINLGITLCIQCSGIHRSLGVHFSKVRSLTLDMWEPELLKLMCELGNGVINQIYEARREELGVRKPQAGDPRQEVEAYIKAKYVERQFVQRCSEEEIRQKVVLMRKQHKRLSGCSDTQTRGTSKPRPASGSSSSSDELDSLFSYFNSSARLRPLRSSDSEVQNLLDESREKMRTSASSSTQNHKDSQSDGVDGSCVGEDGSCVADDGSIGTDECSCGADEVVLGDPSPGLQLYWASLCRRLPEMAEALAHGAPVNWRNPEEEYQTPLIMAVHGLMAVELHSLKPVERIFGPSLNLRKESVALYGENLGLCRKSLDLRKGSLDLRREALDLRREALDLRRESLDLHREALDLKLKTLDLDSLKLEEHLDLHKGSLVTCEFLLQNSASVNLQDSRGRGPLHHATILGHTGQVCLFLKRGANQSAADIENQTPLAIAVQAANADIVTLLRLAKMNEEMRESEGPYSPSGDETYQDIFQDFSQMASNDPDKLKRF
ncbi:hypothetical protein DNTS_032952 [Danionella cerebrum]|uniref:Arf-GAP with coiled-coil, ANK repeat and PH domain-containing protein n=1 Tax=Danionella cerebrum TaxID=2873325 RepID=A0A553Q2G7_9TELE|nr:hypothetical protein DNTS_032952 [Danionella translucida]